METSAKYSVGCVPYVNAIPLVMRFEDLGDESPVEVIYDVPSKLPAMIDSGRVQAALVSSIDAFRHPGRKIARGVCIGSHGPVKSVRLFSKVPPNQIKSLAHDASSLTSNRLAQIVLAERYGAHPETLNLAPDLGAMLQAADACVLIGDIGMAADGTGLHVLDLGEEWRELTGKPFVWAGWIGDERLTSELATWLFVASAFRYVGRRLPVEPSFGNRVRQILATPIGRGARDVTQEDPEPVRKKLIDRAMRLAHWEPEVIRDYYLNVMVYEFLDPKLEGLREFQRRLLANGFEDCRYFPEVVEPDIRVSVRNLYPDRAR